MMVLEWLENDIITFKAQLNVGHFAHTDVQQCDFIPVFSIIAQENYKMEKGNDKVCFPSLRPQITANFVKFWTIFYTYCLRNWVLNFTSWFLHEDATYPKIFHDSMIRLLKVTVFILTALCNLVLDFTSWFYHPVCYLVSKHISWFKSDC